MAFTKRSVKDDWYATLDGAINSSVTSLVIDGAGVGAEPTAPFYLDIDGEQMECTAVAASTPSAGHSTLTVTRGANSTTAASHADNATVEQRNYAAHITEIQNVLVGTEAINAILRIAGSSPILYLEESDQGADEKNWRLALGASAFNILAVNDAKSAATQALSITRIGTNIDAIQLLADRTVVSEFLNFSTPTELTISTGAVTATRSRHTIDTEADAASDDLDTINGGSGGDMLVIQANNTARTVVIKHNTGNIYLKGGADISLDDNIKSLALIYDATNSKWTDL